MIKKQGKRKIRRLNIATHRDLGYFFSTLIIVYCISGLALNHINDWNPDFIIKKKIIQIPSDIKTSKIDRGEILKLSALVKEKDYKVFDFPTTDQVKIYFDNASLHVNLSEGTALYEQISRRPIFYESNLFHRNSIKGWKWVSDVFAVMLILINITGLFILKGKHGLTRRGKWLIAAGALPPVAALIVASLI